MLAIAGGKGGSGKTTTTLGLARAHPGPVLAADLDWDMPTLHALARVERPDATARTDAERPWGPAWDGRTTAGEFDCDVLPAPRGSNRPDRRSALSRLESATETILLDCPCGIGPDAVTPLSAADGVVIVTSPCRASLRGAAKTAAAARAVGTPVVGTIATRTATAGSRLGKLLEAPVLTTVPETDGKPLAAETVRTAYRRGIDRLVANRAIDPAEHQEHREQQKLTHQPG